MRKNKFFRTGEIAALCTATNMTRTQVYKYLRRDRVATFENGVILDIASICLYGKDRRIPWYDWVAATTTTHPAFFDLTPLQRKTAQTKLALSITKITSALHNLEKMQVLLDQTQIKNLFDATNEHYHARLRAKIIEIVRDIPPGVEVGDAVDPEQIDELARYIRDANIHDPTKIDDEKKKIIEAFGTQFTEGDRNG